LFVVKFLPNNAMQNGVAFLDQSAPVTIIGDNTKFAVFL